MILVILTALTAVCGAAKLDHNYLPPITAKTAGGTAGELQAPFDGSNQGFGGLPTGSYTNDVQGVVVDAVNPGTRTSGAEPTGLGGPRTTYGSLDSKVGDAAFRGSVTGLGSSDGPNTRIAPGFGSFVESDESDKTRGSNLKFTSDVTLDNYSYGYNTDNGISVGENGVAANGVQAEGGYSYKGDDGKTYSVTYTADEGGYKPQGHHLPTPPPIPDEIIKSLEKNAKEEAAGHVDDGSYDASKYNEEGDYSSNGAGNNNARPTIGGGDATASGSFESHSNQAHRPSSGVLIGSYNSGSFDSHSSQVHAAQGFGDVSDNKQSGFGLNKEHRGSQGVGVSGDSSSIAGQFGQSGASTSQVGNNYGSHGQFGANSQFSSQGAHSTENRFGVQATKPAGTDASAFSGLHSQGHTQGSLSSSPGRTQSFGLPGHSNVNSAYSSAVTSGSGSASAFASTGPSDSGFRNEYNLPLNSFGSAGQYTHNSKSGSDSSAGASFPTPSTASASASVSGTPTFGTHNQQYGGTHEHSGSQQYSGSHHALPSVSPQYSTSFPIVHGTTAAPPFSSTGTPSFGTVNSNKEPTLTHSNSGSYSQSGHSSEAGVVGEYLPPVNKVDYTGQVSHSSNVQGAHSPTAASTPYYHTHNQSPNLPSSASSSASVTGNQHSYGQSNQQFNNFNTDSNNFPSRFGESQQSGNSVENSEYLPPVNIIESTNRPTYHSKPQGFDYSSAHTHTHSSETSSSGSAKPTSGSSGFGVSSQQTGFQSQSFNSKPGQYTQNNNVIPLPSGQTQFGNTNTHFSSVQPTQPTVGFEGFSSQGPSNVPSTTPAAFSHQTSHIQHIPSTTPATSFSSSQETSQSGSAFQPQSKFPSQLASGQYKPTDTTYASSTQQPALGQQQGFDASYYYMHPSKPFITPSTAPNSQFSNNGQPNFSASSSSQQGSKYPNTPTTPTTGQYQNPSSSSYNGITQAAISPFPSGSPLTSTQSSQFGSKPTQSSQFGQSLSSQQTSTQFGATGNQHTFSPEPVALFGQKPIVQSQTQFSQSSTSQTSDGSQPTQQYQGTIYQYNKPAVTLPAPEHKDTSSSFGLVTSSQTDSHAKPSQISTDSKFGSQQGSSQFSSQSFGNKPTSGSTFQQTQTGQGSNFGSQSNNQFGQNPQTSQGTISTSVVSQGQSVQTSQFSQKPSVSSQTTGSNYQQSQFNQKPQTSQGSIFSSNTNTQSQQSQFGKKPTSSTQSGSYYQQTTPSIGLSASPVTQSPTSFGQKPFGSSQTTGFQKTQFGASGSHFGQKPQNTQVSSGISNSYSQSQTSQFGKKPFGTTQTGSNFQQTQFGSQFNQNSQSQGTSGLTSTAGQTTFGQKPSQTGSSYQQTQFESTGSQFGQKPQSTIQGSSIISNTGSKDQSVQTSQFGFGSSQNTGYSSQNNQFGSGLQYGKNPQASQGVAPSSQLGQTSQTGQKLSGSSSGASSSFQQNQFASSSGSQFSQTPQTAQTAQGTISQVQPVKPTQFGIKPFGSSQSSQGSTSQQTQFGSTPSRFGETSQSSQVPTLTTISQTVQPTYFGHKPFGTSQNTDSSVQKNQFGTSGSVFGQKPQTVQTTQSPTSSFGSYSQSSQFGTQTKKPYGSTQTPFQTQFGSTTGQFGQKPQVQANAFASSSGSNVGSFGTQTGQSSQYGTQSQGATSFGSQVQKPVGSSLSQTNYQQSQYSQTSGKYGSQTSQSNVGSGQVAGQPSFSAVTQKPFGSQTTLTPYQQTQFNQGLKPFGTSQNTGSSVQNNQFGTSGTVFGQKPLTVQTTQAPVSSFGSYSQSSQFGTQTKKPYGSTEKPLQTQFGSTTGQFGQKPQVQANAFASSSGSNVGSFGSSQTGQTSQYSQTSGKYGSQTSQSNVGSGQVAGQTSFSAVTQKPFGSQTTQTPYQQTQFNQVLKPFGTSQNTGSSVQNNQFGTSGTVFGQKPLTVQTTQAPVSSFGSYSQSSQFGTQTKKPYGSTEKPLQTQFGSTTGQFGQKPQVQANAFASSSGSNVGSFGSSQTGQTSQYSQTSGKYGSQTSQSNVGSGQVAGQTSFSAVTQKPFGSQTTQTPYQQTQFNQGLKPFGSSQNTGSSVQKNQFGTSGTVFGQKPLTVQTTQAPVSSFGSYSQSSQFGTQTKKPYGSTEKPLQTQFGSTTGQFGQKPQVQANAFASSSGSNVGSFGSSQTGQTSQFSPQTQGATSFGSAQKPVGSSLSQNNYQQSQYAQTSGTYGSQSQVGQTSQSNVGSGQVAAIRPFGSSSTQGTFQQSQSNTGSTQFGTQPTKATDLIIPHSQASPPQFSGQAFKPASTTSTQGSGFQSQSSAVSSSKFGVQPTKPTGITHFSGQPFKPASTQGSSFGTQALVDSTPQFGVQPTQSAIVTTQNPSQTQFSGEPFKQSGFSSTQAPSFPNRLSSNLNAKPDSHVVSTVQTPEIVSVPGYEVNSSQASYSGQKEQFGGPRDPPRFDDKTGYHY